MSERASKVLREGASFHRNTDSARKRQAEELCSTVKMSSVAHFDQSHAILSDAMLDRLDATTLAQLKRRVAERLVNVLNGPSKYSMDGKVYGCRHIDSADYVYVGSTCETSVSRFNQHCYLASRGSDALFHQHMMEHGGPEKFTCDIIRYVPCKSLKELLKAEEVAIRHFRPMCNINHNTPQTRAIKKGKKRKEVAHLAFEAVPDVDRGATIECGKGKERALARRCAWKRTVKLILDDVAPTERDDKMLYDSLCGAGKHLAWLVNFLMHMGRANHVSRLCDAKVPGSGKVTMDKAALILSDTNLLAEAIGFRHCYDQVTIVDRAKIVASQEKISGLITEIRKRNALPQTSLPQSSLDTYRGLIMGIQSTFLALVGVKLVNVQTNPFKWVGTKVCRLGEYQLVSVNSCMSMLVSNVSQAISPGLSTPVTDNM